MSQAVEPGKNTVLQPRYRRLMSVGELLDESIRLFRQSWMRFALIGSVALIPSGVLLVLASAQGAMAAPFDISRFQPGAPPTLQANPVSFGVTLLLLVIASVLSLLWNAAIAYTTDLFARAVEPRVRSVYARALRRWAAVFGAALLAGIGIVALTLVGTLLFVVTLFGSVGSIVALIGLLVWWLRPTARRTWLKWLIILTAPFGLVVYYFVRWSLFVPAVVLERRGPLGALRRSSQLVHGEWFRTFGAGSVAAIIVILLTFIPAFVVGVVFGLSGTASAPGRPNVVESMVSNAATTLSQILFSSIAVITYTLLFIDLRNRREGADIAERLTQLEAAPTSG